MIIEVILYYIVYLGDIITLTRISNGEVEGGELQSYDIL